MKGNKLIRAIRRMPRGAYIFLRGVLKLCCVLLFLSWLLFIRMRMEGGYPGDTYRLAVLLLETPAALLLLGGVGTAFMIDHFPPGA